MFQKTFKRNLQTRALSAYFLHSWWATEKPSIWIRWIVNWQPLNRRLKANSSSTRTQWLHLFVYCWRRLTKRKQKNKKKKKKAGLHFLPKQCPRHWCCLRSILSGLHKTMLPFTWPTVNVSLVAMYNGTETACRVCTVKLLSWTTVAASALPTSS